MKLYWAPRTRAGRIVWLLEEAGVDYELVHLDIRNPEAKNDPEFRAASPMGKVPALVDGATRLFDSTTICLYVAETVPEARLAPEFGDPLRADFLFWTVFTGIFLEPAVTEKMQGLEPNPTGNGWGSFDRVVELMRNRLADRQWVLGDAFSAADVLIGTSVHYLKQFKLLPDDPGFDAYAERCLSRPGFRHALELDAGQP